MKKTKVYIICPVTSGTPICVYRYVISLLRQGIDVFFPPVDAPQHDQTGVEIVESEKNAIEWADEVHVFWDKTSKGSHFDLGMAYALGKKIKLIDHFSFDDEGKSYYKVIMEWQKQGGHYDS